MLCGPEIFCAPGMAAVRASTTSSCPSMAAEKSVGDQVFRNRAVAYMRGRSQGILPISETPIEGSFGERGAASGSADVAAAAPQRTHGSPKAPGFHSSPCKVQVYGQAP